MSRQFRYRVTALVLGGLIFGAPLLTNGTASAEQMSEAGRQVTFEGGGMFGLSCKSRPDVESMVVPAESTVRLVNRTGFNARLQLGGETKGVLPDEESTEVVFRRGTTAVLLEPNCPLGEDSVPVLVTALPSTPVTTMPDPIPVPSGGDSGASAVPSGPDEPSGQVGVGTTLPDSTPAGTRPTRITPGTGKPGSIGPGKPRTTVATRTATGAKRQASQAADPSTAKIKSRTTAGTGGSAPAFSGMPPGDEKAIAPGVPRTGSDPGATEARPAATTGTPTEVAAAEPVAAMAPIRETGPIGLLALTAAVCVMGVGAAAIRAIVSQRANRAKMA